MSTLLFGRIKMRTVLLSSFFAGITLAVCSASIHAQSGNQDSSLLQSRVQHMLKVIRTNAEKLDGAQRTSYYALVLMNLRNMRTVIAKVDDELIQLVDGSTLQALGVHKKSESPSNTENTVKTGEKAPNQKQNESEQKHTPPSNTVISSPQCNIAKTDAQTAPLDKEDPNLCTIGVVDKFRTRTMGSTTMHDWLCRSATITDEYVGCVATVASEPKCSTKNSGDVQGRLTSGSSLCDAGEVLSFSSREEKGRTHYQWVCRQNNKTLGCSAQGAKASSSNDTHHTDVLQCHPKKTGTIKTTLSVHEELCSKGTLSEFTSKIVDWHPHYEWKCVGKHTTVICSAKSTVVVQDPATMANQPKCGDTYTGVVKNLLQEGSGLCEDGKVKNFTLLMSPNSTNKYALFSWNCDKENGTKPAVCEARYNYPKDDKPTSTITPTSPPKTDVPSSPSNPQKNGGNGTNAKNDSNTSGGIGSEPVLTKEVTLPAPPSHRAMGSIYCVDGKYASFDHNGMNHLVQYLCKDADGERFIGGYTYKGKYNENEARSRVFTNCFAYEISSEASNDTTSFKCYKFAGNTAEALSLKGSYPLTSKGRKKVLERSTHTERYIGSVSCTKVQYDKTVGRYHFFDRTCADQKGHVFISVHHATSSTDRGLGTYNNCFERPSGKNTMGIQCTEEVAPGTNRGLTGYRHATAEDRKTMDFSKFDDASRYPHGGINIGSDGKPVQNGYTPSIGPNSPPRPSGGSLSYTPGISLSGNSPRPQVGGGDSKNASVVLEGVYVGVYQDNKGRDVEFRCEKGDKQPPGEGWERGTLSGCYHRLVQSDGGELTERKCGEGGYSWMCYNDLPRLWGGKFQNPDGVIVEFQCGHTPEANKSTLPSGEGWVKQNDQAGCYHRIDKTSTPSGTSDTSGNSNNDSSGAQNNTGSGSTGKRCGTGAFHWFCPDTTPKVNIEKDTFSNPDGTRVEYECGHTGNSQPSGDGWVKQNDPRGCYHRLAESDTSDSSPKHEEPKHEEPKTFTNPDGTRVEYECGHTGNSQPSGDGWVKQNDSEGCYHRLMK